MARFELRSHPLGVVQDKRGNVQPNKPFTLSGGPLYAASTGGTLQTNLLTNSDGECPGWLDPDVNPGVYTLSASGKTVSLQVGGGVPIPGPAGPQGIPGAPGYSGVVGTMLGEDVWLYGGATPGSVTDWGPIINTLVTNGAKRLLFRDKDFPFTTPIVLASGVGGRHGLVLEGMVGRNWNHSAPVTRLLWKGTGAGRAVDMRGPAVTALVVRDLGIYYDNPLFTGDLIDMQLSAGVRFENVSAGASAPAVLEARCILKMSKVVGNFFQNCMLFGAQSIVRGYEASGFAEFSNQVSFRDCVIADFELFGFCNPGWEWLLDNVNWEWSYNLAGTSGVGVGADIVHIQPSTFTIQGESSFWDNVESTQPSIVQPVGVPWDLKVKETTFHNSGLSVTDVNLQGTGTVHLENLSFAGVSGVYTVDLGNVAANGADSRKDRVTIRNVDGFSDDPNSQIKNIVGHSQVQIENIGETTNGRDPQLRTIGGYERVMSKGSRQRPSVGIHAGHTGMTVQEQSGTDMAGVIRLNTAGVQAAGLAIDVTFGTPMCPDYRSVAWKTWLSVLLTPVGIDTIAANGDEGAGLGLYAQIANATTDVMVTSTGFTIGFKNAPTAGKNFAIAYRVIQL